jgi:hypothetical protein
MTRGRHNNVAHLVAAEAEDAREQWIAAFARDRADLGPDAAAAAAARAAAGYTRPRPLAGVLAELRSAWSQQLTAHWQLERLQERLEHVRVEAAWQGHCRQALAPFEVTLGTARRAAEQADRAAAGSAAVLTTRAEQHAARLRQAWDSEMSAADLASVTIAAGPGRLGIHRGRVCDAHDHLDAWTARWAPMLTDSNVDTARLRQAPAAYRSTVEQIADALQAHARRLAAADHPEHAARLRAAEQAAAHYDAVSADYHQARAELRQRSQRPIYETGAADQLSELAAKVQTAQRRVHETDQRVDRLTRDPAITSHPNPHKLLRDAETTWTIEQASAHQHTLAAATGPAGSLRHDPAPVHQVEHGPSIGR